MTQAETECPQDVWFANQVPDFACASVAMLNVVNNIPGLQMGKEMRDFKTFTTDLDPMARGDAIDGFDFLKRIHNSFARETDLLIANMHMRDKMNRAKKRQAIIQAQATKKAKKAAKMSENKRADSAVTTPTRASNRKLKPVTKKAEAEEILDSEASSPLSDPPDSDPEFEATNRKKKSSSPAEQPARRSSRQPKPRKDPTKLFSEAEAQPDDEGFHYLAYVPVNGTVWKMDGLDSYPHVVGDFDVEGGGAWTNVAAPDIQARMMMFEGSIQYNLMAVVHDPVGGAKAELAANVRELQAIDAKLDKVCESWKENEDASTDAHGPVLGPCPLLHLENEDLAAAPSPKSLERELAAHEDDSVERLLKLRQQRVKAQAQLRGAVRDGLAFSQDDEVDEMVRLKRHDFGGFVKGWLGELAEQEVLKELVEEEDEE